MFDAWSESAVVSPNRELERQIEQALDALRSDIHPAQQRDAGTSDHALDRGGERGFVPDLEIQDFVDERRITERAFEERSSDARGRMRAEQRLAEIAGSGARKLIE